jgi:hypothetical protein
LLGQQLDAIGGVQIELLGAHGLKKSEGREWRLATVNLIRCGFEMLAREINRRALSITWAGLRTKRQGSMA